MKKGSRHWAASGDQELHDRGAGMHHHGLGREQRARARNRRWGPWWEDWGPEWGGPPPPRGPRGPGRMPRGDIRTALLGALAEGPGHGYEIISRLEQKSGGMWRPSPGSVYPTLQMFEDEGLVRSEERDGKRVYELTEAGRAEAAEREQRFGSAPWEEWVPEGLQQGIRGFLKAGEKLGPMLSPLTLAIRQVAMNADPAKLERAGEVLKRATREIYQILSEG